MDDGPVASRQIELVRGETDVEAVRKYDPVVRTRRISVKVPEKQVGGIRR
jgi:hypothetical protein